MRPLSPFQDTATSMQRALKESQLADVKRQQAWARAMEQEQMNSWLRFGMISRNVVDQYDLKQPNLTAQNTEYESRTGGRETARSSEPNFEERESISQSLFANEASQSSHYPFAVTASSVMLARIDSAGSEKASQVLSEPEVVNDVQPTSASPMLASAGAVGLSKTDTVTLRNQAVDAVNTSRIEMNVEQAPSANVERQQKLQQDFKQFLVSLLTAQGMTQGAQVVELGSQGADHGVVATKYGISARAEQLVKEMDLDTAVESEEVNFDSKKSAAERNNQMRVHTEWTSEGVRIWLGVDQDKGLNIGMLATRIEMWLRDQKIKVLGLVCNGRELLDGTKGKLYLDRFDEIEIDLMSQNLREDKPSLEDLRFVINLGKTV